MSYGNTPALENPIIKPQKLTCGFDFFGSITHSCSEEDSYLLLTCFFAWNLGAKLLIFRNVYIYIYRIYILLFGHSKISSFSGPLHLF